MCKPASMIVTRTSVLMCGTDRHSDIREKHHLRDDLPAGRRDWVPVEIYPDDGDYSRPASEWRLHTDLPLGEWPD
ncbi:hypothetical protein M0R36_10970, partial [bacterium]|nr:hypothetical protein [bacterium]